MRTSENYFPRLPDSSHENDELRAGIRNRYRIVASVIREGDSIAQKVVHNRRVMMHRAHSVRFLQRGMENYKKEKKKYKRRGESNDFCIIYHLPDVS